MSLLMFARYVFCFLPLLVIKQFSYSVLRLACYPFYHCYGGNAYINKGIFPDLAECLLHVEPLINML